jgi:hypothetical protein
LRNDQPGQTPPICMEIGRKSMSMNEKSDKDKPQERIWEMGFEGNSREQLKRRSKLSFALKIKWLEEMPLMILRSKPMTRIKIMATTSVFHWNAI